MFYEKKPNILFVVNTPEFPSGGVKVIYHNCQTLNELGFASEILTDKIPINNTNYNYKVRFREWAKVDPLNDLIVIPEGLAGVLGKWCLNNNYLYAIYVQGGYQIFNDPLQSTDEELEKVYDKATAILSISEDASLVLRYSMKESNHKKITRLIPYIDRALFFYNDDKSNLITYMPRKLGEHADFVKFLLNKRLGSNWKIMPIENLPEERVAEILRESKVFLSFSDREGFALPPLEAALCGNIVVGYHGQGGKEYFSPPVFYEINNGDFIQMAQSVEYAVALTDCNFNESNFFKKQLKELDSTYSFENYCRALTNFYLSAQNELYLHCRL